MRGIGGGGMNMIKTDYMNFSGNSLTAITILFQGRIYKTIIKMIITNTKAKCTLRGEMNPQMSDSTLNG